MKAILFDLDGTLLPMDQDEFVKAYLKLLCKKTAHLGYEPQTLIDAIWKGTAAMIGNDGSVNNETVFWQVFTKIFGEKALLDKSLFDEFYRTDFNEAKKVCGFAHDAKKVINAVKNKGYRVILATNPIFPAVATKARINWAGLSEDEFEWITTYENTSSSKPNPRYYAELTEYLGLIPEDCMMIGNNVTEDMVAATLGMKVFLLTDCLINQENKDISQYPHGGFIQGASGTYRHPSQSG